MLGLYARVSTQEQGQLEHLVDVLNELEVAGGGAVERLGRDGETARDFARESLSPATRRAYQTDVDVFMQWCRERGVATLPAGPEVVAAFLAHEAERGLRASTVARRASGIRLLHRAAGYETPDYLRDCPNHAEGH